MFKNMMSTSGSTLDKSSVQKNTIYTIASLVVSILIFLPMTYLFYLQANDIKAADMIAYITSGREGTESYTIVSQILGFLSLQMEGEYLVAIFVALCVLCTVWGTVCYLSKSLTGANKLVILALALSMNMLMGLYLPSFNTYRQATNTGPTILHNTTYILMKCVAIYAMYFYITAVDKYIEKKSFFIWIRLSCAFVLSALLKPSFILSLSIIMLIELIFDFCKSRGKSFWSNVWLGATVLPTVIVMYLQAQYLFDPSDAKPFQLTAPFQYFITSRNSNVGWSLFQSMAFPLFILAFNFPTFFKNREYRVLTMMGFVGLLPAAFLMETGLRASHGNFIWGYNIGLFFMFIGAAITLYNSIKANKLTENSKKISAVQSIGCALLLWHTMCGFRYVVTFFEDIFGYA